MSRKRNAASARRTRPAARNKSWLSPAAIGLCLTLGGMAVSGIWTAAKLHSKINALSNDQVEMAQSIRDMEKTARTTGIENRLTRIETILEISRPAGNVE